MKGEFGHIDDFPEGYIEPRDEDYWAHEMSDEPEQPDEGYVRMKDLKVEQIVIGLGTVVLYGKDLDGNRTWIMLHMANQPEVKFLNASNYDEG